jgi:hypothetical protein
MCVGGWRHVCINEASKESINQSINHPIKRPVETNVLRLLHGSVKNSTLLLRPCFDVLPSFLRKSLQHLSTTAGMVANPALAAET